MNNGAKPRGPSNVLEWGLDPLFWAYVKLPIRHLHSLPLHGGMKDSHSLWGKPIQFVEIAGVIVAKLDKEEWVKYCVDDGSATIWCTRFQMDKNGVRHDGIGHELALGLGIGVLVLGQLNVFRNEVEVVVSHIRETDLNEEQLHWLQVVKLGRGLYKQPFDRGRFVDDEKLRELLPRVAATCACDSPFSRHLAYCKCLASHNDKDAGFVFRNALLQRLIIWEQELPEDEILTVPFKRVWEDECLMTAAREALDLASDSGSLGSHASCEADSTANGCNANGNGGESSGIKKLSLALLRSAFSSLTQDGILQQDKRNEQEIGYLQKDEYFFMSRSRALEHSIRELQEQAQRAGKPLQLSYADRIIRELQEQSFLRSQPGARIKRCLKLMIEDQMMKEQG
ncbi:unnamed protein product [Chrysoparadoxa australica]